MSYYPKEIELSLSRILRLLDSVGNPHESLPPVIHVAGTNGKGSVSAFLQSILVQSGKKVSVYRSPHLVEFNERINISGINISDRYLLELLEFIKKKNNYKEITFFELITVTAFLAFANSESDILILEVGLGGSLDATNVVKNPIASVITKIDIDHTEYLGDNLVSIAKEKAGIIKSSAPVFSIKQDKNVMKVIEKKCIEKKVSLFAEDYFWKIVDNCILFNKEEINISKCGLLGDHQIQNAALAAMVVIQTKELKIKKKYVKKGIYLTKWEGRIEKLTGFFSRKFPQLSIWIDAAHNVSGFKALNNWILNEKQKVIYILAIGKKKDAKGIISEIAKVRPILVIFIENKEFNFHNTDYLSYLSLKKGLNVSVKESIFEAIKHCSHLTKNTSQKRVIISGSIFFIGDVIKIDRERFN